MYFAAVDLFWTYLSMLCLMCQWKNARDGGKKIDNEQKLENM